jgi:hypothetical protein
MELTHGSETSAQHILTPGKYPKEQLHYYFTFMYSSTCFGRPRAHHQELKNCSISLWFYRRSVVIAVLLVVVGPTTTNSTAITTLQR